MIPNTKISAIGHATYISPPIIRATMPNKHNAINNNSIVIIFCYLLYIIETVEYTRKLEDLFNPLNFVSIFNFHFVGTNLSLYSS